MLPVCRRTERTHRMGLSAYPAINKGCNSNHPVRVCMRSYREYLVRLECVGLQRYAIQSVRADMLTIQPVMANCRNNCDYPGRLFEVLDIQRRKATISTFLERVVEICRTYFLESLHL